MDLRNINPQILYNKPTFINSDNANLVNFTKYNQKDNQIDNQNDQIDNQKDDQINNKIDYIKQDIFTKQKSKYKQEFNEETLEKYVCMRKTRTDPISRNRVLDPYAFRYPYMWNPLTGDILKDENGDPIKDPYGPLYFDCFCLVKYYHKYRTKHLWINQIDEGEEGFVWSGCPGEGLGKGEDFIMNGKKHPDYYLFRLPNLDCYLPKEIPGYSQVITCSPKITEKDIKYIDNIVQNNRNKYYYLFRSYPPKLMEIKKNYDKAIDSNPSIIDAEEYTELKLKELKYQENFNAVQKLLKIK